MATQYTSYYLYQKYEKRGDQEAIPVYPNVYSVDADGTMPKVIKIENDIACGYVPTGTTQYRWLEVPSGESYVCDECDIDIEYRWVSTSAYTYFGDYRYEILQEQYKKEDGEWINTNNTKYGNPVKVGKKLKITMSNGDVFSQSCGTDDGVWYSFNEYDYAATSERAIQHTTNNLLDGVPVIGGYLSEITLSSTGGIQTSEGYGNNYVKKIEFGDCVSELGWRYRNTPWSETGGGCGASYWDNDVAESGQRIRGYLMASFRECGVREIVFPEGLRWIGGNGIFAENMITALTIPSSVESIGFLRSFDQSSPNSSCMSRSSYGAFAGNKYLRNLSLNEGLKSIGAGDFSSCTSLEKVIIPSTLEKMGYSVFGGCTNLKQIIFSGETPPSLICDDDSQYYANQCRGDDAHPALSANSDTLIYVPCGSKSAYTQFIDDMDASKIIEYGGECGDIPSIESMYHVLFLYKIGTATTNVYRGSISASNVYITSLNDFTDVINGYADEIIIPSGTSITGGVKTISCGKLYFNECNITAGAITAHAGEVEINTSNVNETIYGDDTTRKVTVGSGYTPTLWGSFMNCGNISEVYIHGNPTLKGAAFAGCTGLNDIYITYTGGTLEVVLNSDTPVLAGTSPTIHVPCDLYWSYKGNSFWGNFNLVVDDEQ